MREVIDGRERESHVGGTREKEEGYSHTGGIRERGSHTGRMRVGEEG